MEISEMMGKEVLHVTEDGKTYSYTRSHTSVGIPYYNPPEEKYDNESHKYIMGKYYISEYLLLPISNKDFSNKKDLFYGYKIQIGVSDPYILGLIHSPSNAISITEMMYEVCRIRYYPEDDKTICIDRQNDPLFPYQIIDVKLARDEMKSGIYQNINDILDYYCSFYVDKRV